MDWLCGNKGDSRAVQLAPLNLSDSSSSHAGGNSTTHQQLNLVMSPHRARCLDHTGRLRVCRNAASASGLGVCGRLQSFETAAPAKQGSPQYW
jgi:hypothetical protein